MTKNQINKQLVATAFGKPSKRIQNFELAFIIHSGYELPWLEDHITEREIHLRQALRHEGIFDAKGMNQPLGS